MKQDEGGAGAPGAEHHPAVAAGGGEVFGLCFEFGERFVAGGHRVHAEPLVHSFAEIHRTGFLPVRGVRKHRAGALTSRGRNRSVGAKGETAWRVSNIATARISPRRTRIC